MMRLSHECAAGAPFLCVDPRCQSELHGATPVGHFQPPAAPFDSMRDMEQLLDKIHAEARAADLVLACTACRSGAHDLCFRAIDAFDPPQQLVPPQPHTPCGCVACYSVEVST